MIYLQDFINKKPQTFDDVLNVLFNYAISSRSLVPTYSDEECTILECSYDRRRSFQALFEIARTYFPDITINEVFESIKRKRLSYYVCRDIRKVVFHYRGRFYLNNLSDFIDTLDNEYIYDNIIISELKTFINDNS